MNSQRNDLNLHDFKIWGRNTLLFSTPALLAFLLALQSGTNLSFALGAGYSALLSSIIDLIKKFIAGEVK